jgi:hypothetical protein
VGGTTALPHGATVGGTGRRPDEHWEAPGMTIGPVEYIVLGFPENRFDGSIAPELMKLVDDGTIRIIDLVFITKDVDGTVAAVEFDDHEDLAPFGSIEGEVGGLISPEDVEYVADGLEPDSAVALLVWEDLWAKPLVEALRAAGGILVEGARIPHDLVEPALDELESVG